MTKQIILKVGDVLVSKNTGTTITIQGESRSPTGKHTLIAFVDNPLMGKSTIEQGVGYFHRLLDWDYLVVCKYEFPEELD